MDYHDEIMVDWRNASFDIVSERNAEEYLFCTLWSKTVKPH